MRSAHSDRVERYLAGEAQIISAAMRGFHGRRPVQILGADWKLAVTNDGDFIAEGKQGGQEACLMQRLADAERRERNFRMARARRQTGAVDIATILGNKWRLKKERMMKSVGSAATNVWHDAWYVAGTTPAGAAGSAAPGGKVWSSADAGAPQFDDPVSGEAAYGAGIEFMHATQTGSVMVYDRLFSVAKTMNSTATEAVTGVPTRYQSTVQGAYDSAENNFLFIVAPTVLPATAHNWTVCQYTDQSGNTLQTLPSVTGNASNQATRLDMPSGWWFCPLDTGDSGIQRLTQMQCSALVATGTIDFVIGHPLAWCPLVNTLRMSGDGFNSALWLERIYPGACLSFFQMSAQGSAQLTGGTLRVVYG